MDDLKHLHLSFDHDGSVSDSLKPRLILVEDDFSFGKPLKKYIEKKLGLEVDYFEDPDSCVEFLTNLKDLNTLDKFCLVTDISFKMECATDGLLLIDILRDKGFEFVPLVMTGFASIETAIQATKKDVFHYLTKPFELDKLVDLIKNAFQTQLNYSFKEIAQPKTEDSIINKNSRKNLKYRLELPTEEDVFCGMIGRSNKMKVVFDRVQRVAASDSTVLIGGPSGTGKELIANAIHKLSNRMSQSMISVNCGAIPAELLESELFGHEKGAFTGAISSRKGRFELANKGSIFLDEIGDMPLLLQVKLLRVLQNRVIERVGSSETTPIDVRIITATHRDLEEAVTAGDFREDLYYRLNVIPIKIPPLCARREDIPLLISYFLSRFVSADLRNNVEFSSDALDMLVGYDWPGNVRELENLMERLVILKGGATIEVEDLPKKFLQNTSFENNTADLLQLPEDGMNLKSVLSNIEESLIMQALDKTGGNKNQASKLLHLNRTTLIEKMKKKGMNTLNL
ncbi:MAG: sigma-54-dependent Fis family transcriptional regulator [Bacteriovoracaceae bacterium]|jgi:two-component system, NtrC family, response regulator PilR|nr:sigma-54-dependent Fis family transcriptional regulator [Bacteriovoracaceae bacterium]